jgi:hypothetical protein
MTVLFSGVAYLPQQELHIKISFRHVVFVVVVTVVLFIEKNPSHQSHYVSTLKFKSPYHEFCCLVIQGDQKVSVYLMITIQNTNWLNLNV